MSKAAGKISTALDTVASNEDYIAFLDDLETKFSENSTVIGQTLANVFSMREIGNKTHGDLAEIAITQYINQHVDGYTAVHTGKKMFRSKKSEEDIIVTSAQSSKEIPMSLKAYGSGPLQLSTNKQASMFAALTTTLGRTTLTDKKQICQLLSSAAFSDFGQVNVLPLIYDESEASFSISVFELKRAYENVAKIAFYPPRLLPNGKTSFPIYKFLDATGQYILEVRYGDGKANALQRGMWTNTKNAAPFFRHLLTGNYQTNQTLLDLIPKLLVADEAVHQQLLKSIAVADTKAT